MLIQIGLRGIYPVCVNPRNVTAAEITEDDRQEGAVKWTFAVGNEILSSRMFDSVLLAVQAYKDAYREAKELGYGKLE